jgi:hypothetical protein
MQLLDHGITKWEVGDRAKITKRSWEFIRNGNRSILAFPDDQFVNMAYVLMTNETPGTVTERFDPGYEVNVTFDDGTILQMKDHWIDPA